MHAQRSGESVGLPRRQLLRLALAGTAGAAVADPLPRLDQYGVILLGSPIWNVRACAGAGIGEGLAVRGEQSHRARPQVVDWLQCIGLR